MKEQKKINRKAGCMFTGIIEEVGEHEEEYVPKWDI